VAWAFAGEWDGAKRPGWKPRLDVTARYLKSMVNGRGGFRRFADGLLSGLLPAEPRGPGFVLLTYQPRNPYEI
jgi:hypothetical protein